jgi:hypothetical protein
MAYYVKNSKNEIKPYSEEQLIAAAKNGQLGSHDLLSRSTNGPWVRALKTKKLQKYLPASQPVSSSQGSAPSLPHSSCKFCLASVKPNARKCQHCGEWLDGTVEHDLLSNIIAGILSFLIPGGGQFYHGQTIVGLVVLAFALFCYVLGMQQSPYLVLAGLAHLSSIISALTTIPENSAQKKR